MKRILAVNPHFYDFSAFDFWAKPLGFLYLLGILKNLGFEVDLIDCLDRNHPALAGLTELTGLTGLTGKFKKKNQFGTGHYYSELAAKPAILADVPLTYKRFGLPEKVFKDELARLSGVEGKMPPDLILVTSGMTYWYPGVWETIRILKEIFPKVPVVLGGTYATLLTEHAEKFSKADRVFGAGQLGEFWKFLERELGPFADRPHKARPPENFSDFPAPDFSFYRAPEYAVLKTGEGCPFDCTYCAVKKISPEFVKKPLEKVANEIEDFSRAGLQNLAFYDDALLYPTDYFENLLEKIKRRKIKMFFHASNGLHARKITAKIAYLMKENNFVLPRLSLETSDAGRQQSTGGKVTNADFERALAHFRAAGYQPGQVGVYLLCGLPGQSLEEVEDSINYAASLGARVTLAEFSPTPGTADFESSGLKDKDPLLSNNSIFPLYPRSTWPQFQKLKDLVKKQNRSFF